MARECLRRAVQARRRQGVGVVGYRGVQVAPAPGQAVNDHGSVQGLQVLHPGMFVSDEAWGLKVRMIHSL